MQIFQVPVIGDQPLFATCFNAASRDFLANRPCYWWPGRLRRMKFRGARRMLTVVLGIPASCAPNPAVPHTHKRRWTEKQAGARGQPIQIIVYTGQDRRADLSAETETAQRPRLSNRFKLKPANKM